MRHRPYITLLAAVVLSGTALAACGGKSNSSEASTTPLVTEATETTAAPTSTEASTTVATTVAPAEFDGPSFLDVIDPALVPYNAVLGASPDSAEVRALLSALGEDVPLPAGLTVNGLGHQWTSGFGRVEDAQTVSFNEFLDAAQLEAFGGSVSNGWKQSSLATSGSLTTLLLTHTDGRRVVFVSDSKATATGTGRAPLEMRVSADITPATPGWFAALPALAGGEVVEYVEASGRILDNLAGIGDYVSVRWRYPASQLDALNAHLTSGVVQSAGFTYDKDTFNGFEALVDITIGSWTGTVMIGSASVDGVDFYDLVWSLNRG